MTKAVYRTLGSAWWLVQLIFMQEMKFKYLYLGPPTSHWWLADLNYAVPVLNIGLGSRGTTHSPVHPSIRTSR